MGTLTNEQTATQKDLILRFMQENGSITQIEAAQEIGCWRLGARIFDLKRDGHNIKKDTVLRKNRYGKPISFARYRLVSEGE